MKHIPGPLAPFEVILGSILAMLWFLNIPSVQGVLSVWKPSAQVSAALAHVGPPSVTGFFSGRRPGAPSPASAAASELGTRFPVLLLTSSGEENKEQCRCWCYKYLTTDGVTWNSSYRLWSHHFVDALFILLSQNSQLTCLLLFQVLQDCFMVPFGRHFQLMVPKSLVLLVLHLARILELFLDLHLQHLLRVRQYTQGRHRLKVGQNSSLTWAHWTTKIKIKKPTEMLSKSSKPKFNCFFL